MQILQIEISRRLSVRPSVRLSVRMQSHEV
jgi:hypothetical protein